VKNPSASDSPAKSSGHHALFKWVDSRIVLLTLFNALLYWPWRWLRSDYDAGIRHPDLVLIMMAITLWGWWQLLLAVTNRINGGRGN
jgi:hypothetical protein